MTKKYYIPKCFVKGFKEKTKRFETCVCSFNFFIEGNNVYVQANLNMHLNSKT